MPLRCLLLGTLPASLPRAQSCFKEHHSEIRFAEMMTCFADGIGLCDHWREILAMHHKLSLIHSHQSQLQQFGIEKEALQYLQVWKTNVG